MNVYHSNRNPSYKYGDILKKHKHQMHVHALVTIMSKEYNRSFFFFGGKPQIELYKIQNFFLSFFL